MAEIKPFRMVRYNGQCAGDLDKLITPPYDVISPSEQEAFYQAHPLNMIRLVLGKQYSDDSDGNNRYTRAAATLQEWMEDGTFIRADSLGFTVYQMEFSVPDGGRAAIDGIVALVRVDDYGMGKVLPHEKTYKGPREDQLNIMKSCRAHMTPIHALFDDKTGLVRELYKPFMSGTPEQETTDVNGNVHRTWTLDEEGTVARIKEMILDESIFIADGHHRYETARAFKKEMNASPGSDPTGEAEFVMMYLTAMSHPGLVIRPAHRLVRGLKEIDGDELMCWLEPCFDTDAMEFSEHNREQVAEEFFRRIGEHSLTGGAFGAFLGNENRFRFMKVKEFSCVEGYIDPDIPDPLKLLDVTILREVVISRGLGIDKDSLENHLSYTPSAWSAMEKVLRKEVQIAFIINPTRVDQMRRAAELGHKLPQKSTYFYPKLSSGLVMHVF